jgi:hypothetical protein
MSVITDQAEGIMRVYKSNLWVCRSDKQNCFKIC